MDDCKSKRWSPERAADWAERTGWLAGANYNPRTASNQLEMWQADTFDPDTIKQELRWSAELGFNCHRVYLHDLLWKDPDGFKQRLDTFLNICTDTCHRVIPVLFDDCWLPEPQLGPQPDPVPGKHNSQWVQSPARSIKARWNDDDRARLKTYVQGVLDHLRDHPAVALWDLYNEPGSRMYSDHGADPAEGFDSARVLEAVFDWAREIDPSQPLTAGLHNAGDRFVDINPRQQRLSDVLTFHHYGTADQLSGVVDWARGGESKKRPLLCTEYMARTRGCTFASHLPILKAMNIGAINWGFVDGRSQTKYAWGKLLPGEEPDPWFHEVLRADGSPYRREEADLIRSVTGAGETH